MSVKLTVPNCLQDDPEQGEKFIETVLPYAYMTPLIWDMHRVDFINPYGALLMLSMARHVSHSSTARVELTNMRDDILSYLERMNLFERGKPWLFTKQKLKKKLARNLASPNLLEITHLQTVRDRTQFLSRTRKVLNTWLASRAKEIDEIISALSEISGNAAEHSQDQGHVMIQKYVHSDHVEVDIVVVDLGIGINGSLSQKYPSKTDEDYIKLALQGYSSRGQRQGGAGLRIVQKHVLTRNGELAIRSGRGFAKVVPKNETQLFLKRFNVVFFPGTQVSLKLRS